MTDRYRHKKRGTIYSIVGMATVQCEPSADLADGEALILYKDENGQFWVRRHEEFHDGRFEKIERQVIAHAYHSRVKDGACTDCGKLKQDH